MLPASPDADRLDQAVSMKLDDNDRRLLRIAALDSIAFGLTHHRPMTVAAADYPAALRVEKATFVTLRHADELLGCIGSLRPHRPLIGDVVHNAYAAAFSDPRFAPLTDEQLHDLDLHISILGPLEPLTVRSEDDLLSRLRPGVDGLLLEDGDCAATFLPAMWPRLGTPRAFVRALKEKAHLPRDYWSATMRAYRYAVDDV